LQSAINQSINQLLAVLCNKQRTNEAGFIIDSVLLVNTLIPEN